VGEETAAVPSAAVSPASAPKIALALAGGGLEGAIYEIGALRALDEACDGLDLNQLFLYVGVSAGAFIAACLANDLTTAQMCRAIVSHEPGEHPFVPETFLTPAVRQWWRGGSALPRLFIEAIAEYVRRPAELSLLESMTRLGRALPVAVFDNEPIRTYLEKIYNLKSRTDDFRQLGKRLVIVAADLDSGQAVRFGEPGMDHVPISRAVQASTALPGLYPPVEINGRHIVDGVLLKTLHASVALEAGATMVLCINPIVSVDTAHAVESGLMKRGNLVDRGLPTVLSQTLRTIIHSRLDVGMASYKTKYEGAEVVLLEPEHDDYLMFFTNIFGFSERRAVCEHAYRSTRRHLLKHYSTLAEAFGRHGVTLRRDVLLEERGLWAQVGLPQYAATPAATRASLGTPPVASSPAVVQRLDAALRRLEELAARAATAETAETAATAETHATMAAAAAGEAASPCGPPIAPLPELPPAA
jgi:NTE family protein